MRRDGTVRVSPRRVVKTTAATSGASFGASRLGRIAVRRQSPKVYAMKKDIPAVLLIWTIVAAGCSNAPATPSPSSIEIFREIIVGDHQELLLGATVPTDVRPLLTPVDADTYDLRAGTFGGADRITVEVGPDSRVHEVRFLYGAGEPYQELLHAYRDMLGAPVYEVNSGPQSIARWEDSATGFEVSRRGSVVESRLYDRSLASP